MQVRWFKTIVQDLNGNSLAAGSTVTFALNSGISNAAAKQVGPTSVGCDAGQGGQSYAVTLSAGGTGPGTTLTVTATSPSKTVSYLNVPVTFN